MTPILITIIILLATLLIGQYIISDNLKIDNQSLKNEIVHLRRLAKLVRDGASQDETPEYFNQFKTINHCTILDEKCLFRLFKNIEKLKIQIEGLKRMNTRLRLLSNKAVSGQKEMTDAFNSFGISVIDSSGKQKKAIALVEELSGRRRYVRNGEAKDE